MVINPENCKFGHSSLTCFASSTHSDGSTPDLAGTTSKLDQNDQKEEETPRLPYHMNISLYISEVRKEIIYPNPEGKMTTAIKGDIRDNTGAYIPPHWYSLGQELSVAVFQAHSLLDLSDLRPAKFSLE